MNYRQFLQHVAKSKGVSGGALEDAMKLIAFHETGPKQRMSPSAKQEGGGPGNGLFMFEAGAGKGGITAVNRTVNHLLKKLKIKPPGWLAKLYKKSSLNASSLSADQQKYIFLGNYLEHPKADLAKLSGGDGAIANFWLKYHWAGPASQKKERLKSFVHSVKAARGKQRVAVKENELITDMKKLFENWRKFVSEDRLISERRGSYAGRGPSLSRAPRPESPRPELTEEEEQKNISYSGVVLDGPSKQKLLSLDIPEGWEIISHHMTITMGPLVHKKGKHDFSETYPVGSEIQLPILAVGQDERAMAVKVEAPNPIKTKSWPHVTVAVNRNEGGKPFHSNKIPEENFQPLSGITLVGTVEEVPQ
mgnify:CR=1 FL=1|tara:strand:- start:2923 stop:4011 length:1089 start_codon:yes stop_codon:yes gene_type:complete